MAASVSKWTRKGTNTDAGANSAGSLNPGDALIDNVVRRECHMWLDDTAAIYTDAFDWSVSGDFTVALNVTKADITADAGDVDVDIEGSVDGTNYVKMADLVTWNAGGGAQAEVVGLGIYDYDASGRMPYMRIAADCGSDAGSVSVGVKIVVTPH
tara:strand:+ start:833 stop:1297 length:465 start_codon:yes stop_codon:yes gene_type:complete